jgi:hypothetical protein
MYSHEHRRKQNSSNTPPVNRFASRKSFVQPSQPMIPEQEQASKAEAERIKAAGSNWPDVSLFTNRPQPVVPPRVQMKRKIEQLNNTGENQQLQKIPVVNIYEKNPNNFERPLFDSEIKYAKEIFADSLDYSVIRITRHNLASTGASKTIGNTIHLQDGDEKYPLFAQDGKNLTEIGRRVLIHEMAHVWQYQNGGWKYAPDSLLSQLGAFITTGKRENAYHWKEPHSKKVPWEQWNPEQQASAVEEYNVRLRNIKSGSDKTEDFQIVAVLKPYIDLVQKREGAPKYTNPLQPPAINLPQLHNPISIPKLPRLPKLFDPTGVPNYD